MLRRPAGGREGGEGRTYRAGHEAWGHVVTELRDGARPFLDRTAGPAREFGGVGIGCDVIASTESETSAATVRGDAFVRTVFSEGPILATRRGGP
jgi:hypothetical protein